MKKLFVTLLCAMLALPCAALCETMFSGEVTAGQTQVITAPYGGIVQNVAVRVGDSVDIGDAIASIAQSSVTNSFFILINPPFCERHQWGYETQQTFRKLS